jgi:hypothetical protein
LALSSSLPIRLLRDAEANYISFGLRLEMPAADHKRTLQRLCEWYEQGRRLQDPTHTRQLIHSLVGSENVLVRRWAIKALALIGHVDDFRRIADRLRVEEDREAQTWGVTGLVRNAQERGLAEICEIAGLANSTAISLAARLYAPRSWLANHADETRISLDDDELTLKWAIFLIGYGKAPVDLFHPKFSNEVFLGELNAHPSPEISEYSIWGLWERHEFGASFSKVPLVDAGKHPESVRKWLYRLATQSPSDVGFDPDTLADLRRDVAAKAREGLAQGVADLPADAYGDEVIEWYSVEDNPRVRENLLVSMAVRNLESSTYTDAVVAQFAKEQPDSAVRHRLLAASVNSPLYQRLRSLDRTADSARQGLLEYGDAAVIQVAGDLNMGATFNVGGNLNAQNLAGGDMIGSANAAVQQLQRSDEGAAEALKMVLDMLERSKDAPGSSEVAAAVKQVADAPTPENKKSLLERVKGWVAGAAAAGTIVTGADKVILVLSSLVI